MLSPQRSSPFLAASLWPPTSPSLPSDSGGAAAFPPAVAAGFSAALRVPSRCHFSAVQYRKL